MSESVTQVDLQKAIAAEIEKLLKEQRQEIVRSAHEQLRLKKKSSGDA